MVLIRILLALLLAWALAGPAAAHKDHQAKKAQQEAAAGAAAPVPIPGNAVAHPMSETVHEAVKDDIDRLEREAARPLQERLLDWLGRIHPFAVHFPLALFPIAWVALILARRHDREVDLLRAIVIVAGAAAVLAALLGWFNAGWTISDKDPLLLWHRWLGTAIALAGAALAAWAWRGDSQFGGRPMVWSLGLLTLALLIQGWLGGALIHGIDHLAW